MQMIAFEIDYGPFEREITFPVDVESIRRKPSSVTDCSGFRCL